MIITPEILAQIAPGSKKSHGKLLPGLSEYMNEWFPKFDIDTDQEMRHIIAQLAHESDSFNTLEEYGSGKAYEGRTDLGNLYAGDGERYKGRGPIQTTGRTNYARLGNVLGKPTMFLEKPELLETPQWGIWAACVFWDDRKLNDIANMPDDSLIYVKRFQRGLKPVEYITYRVNGGLTHIAHRMRFYDKAKQIIITPNQ